MRRILAGFVVCCLCWPNLPSASASVAHALELTLHQLKHTRWMADDGAPSRILALAQARNGFLWIGTADGLYRFDGVIFEKIPSPEADDEGLRVASLLEASDGTLWIGYSNGSLTNYRGGDLHNASTPLSRAFVLRLLQTSDGAIWAVLGGGNESLLRYSEGRWQRVSAQLGLPKGPLIDARAVSDGSLWVTTLHSALRLAPRSRHFEQVADVNGHAAVSGGPQGTIWISDDRGSRMVWPTEQASRRTEIFPTPHSTANFRTLFDRGGNLWGADSDGVFRVRGASTSQDRSSTGLAARVEQFSAADGLTSDVTDPIMEDREGNIWVGTSRGLDMFRAASVVVEPGLGKVPIQGFNLFGASDGTVYIGASDSVYRVKDNGRPEVILRNTPQTETICEGPKSEIWFFFRDRVLELRNNLVATHAPPAMNDDGIQSCFFDASDVLWANGQSAGLFRWQAGAWKRAPPDRTRVTASWLTQDRDGKPLMFLESGAIVSADLDAHPRRELFHPPGHVSLLHQGLNALYVGGDFGLTRIRKDGTRTLSSRKFWWLRDVSGMVETRAGQTWMADKAGIVEVDTGALERAFSVPSAVLRTTVLDFADGLPDFISRLNERPQAARGGDGRVWFATGDGVVWVDPDRLPHNPVPPPVAIRALVANNTVFRDPAQLVLPAGVSNVAIEYSGLSLSVPGRVRFRYRVDGVDNNWVDAGTRREAFYTNLEPGSYRFHIIAANEAGVWNTSGASVSFMIAPTFLQSWYFVAICGLIGIALLWGLYRLRLEQMAGRVRSRLEERVRERERIARELHDTLLQSVQGLVLRFYAAVEKMPADAPRRELERTIERADEVLADARDRVRLLRAVDNRSDLPGALREAGEELAAGQTAKFRMIVEGTARELHAIAFEELIWIGREALNNSFTHADARQVVAEITYHWRELRIQLWDDGRGLPRDVAIAGARAGHFGLVGIRERVKRIRGRLTMRTRHGSGTALTVVIPAAVAYRDNRGRWSLGGIRRLFAEEIEP